MSASWYMSSGVGNRYVFMKGVIEGQILTLCRQQPCVFQLPPPTYPRSSQVHHFHE